MFHIGVVLSFLYAHTTLQQTQHDTPPEWPVLLQGDLLSKFRREQLQAPPLWQLQHYHRCTCGLFTLAGHR